MKKLTIILGCIAVLGAASVLIGLPKHSALAQPSPRGMPVYRATMTSSTAATAVWATATEERFMVENIVFSSNGQMNVQLLDGAEELGTYYLSANEPVVIPGLGLRSVAANNDLRIIPSTTDSLTVLVTGMSLWY